MSTELQPLFPAPSNSASNLTVIESSRAVQEVQAAMVIAKKFPRDQKAAMDRILNACTRPGLANAAVYQYARGGTDITGPSIRLAEALAQEWGNVQVGIRELEQQDGESTVESFAWDLETNYRQTKTFQVRHERHTKTGVKALTDPRDIYELVANQGARRLRACILGVIPGDVVEAALNQCETTMAADADVSPEAQKKMLEAFAKFNVTKEQIEALTQRRMDAITPAQVVRLKKIYASLKDGMSKPEEWFPAVVATAKVPDKKKEKPAAKDYGDATDSLLAKVDESGITRQRALAVIIENAACDPGRKALNELTGQEAAAVLDQWPMFEKLCREEAP